MSELDVLDVLDVSVDDRRALWALTTRHLRSEAHPAVLVACHAIRRGAEHIEVRTRGNRVVVSDDGAALDAELRECITVLRKPDVALLQRLEHLHGTDLLVATATAASAELHGKHGQRLRTINGHVDRAVVDVPSARNVVVLHRPRRLRALERQELQAWLPSPRVSIVVDGKRLGAPSALPRSTVLPHWPVVAGGRLHLGFALDDTVTRLTILARGVWVAQEHLRVRGLPLVAVWDDDTVPTRPGDIVTIARDAIAATGETALHTLASTFSTQPLRIRLRLRSLLMRAPMLVPAFVDVPLFDSERAPFSLPFSALRDQGRLVLGGSGGDVIVDDDARAFLHRTLPLVVVDAVAAPPRRLRFRLQQLLR